MGATLLFTRNLIFEDGLQSTITFSMVSDSDVGGAGLGKLVFHHIISKIVFITSMTFFKHSIFQKKKKMGVWCFLLPNFINTLILKSHFKNSVFHHLVVTNPLSKCRTLLFMKFQKLCMWLLQDEFICKVAIRILLKC